MAVNKYVIDEFTPKPNQVGMSHSFHAKAVVDNIITNKELAKSASQQPAAPEDDSTSGNQGGTTPTTNGENSEP